MRVQSRKSNGTRIFSISRNGKTLVNGLFRKRKGFKSHRSGKKLGFTTNGTTFNQFHVLPFTLGIEKRTPIRNLWNWS